MMDKMIKLGQIAQALETLNTVSVETLNEMVQIDSTISELLDSISNKFASVTARTVVPYDPEPVTETTDVPTHSTQNSGIVYKRIPDIFMKSTDGDIENYFIGSDGFVYHRQISDDGSRQEYIKVIHRGGAATITGQLEARINSRRWAKVKPIVLKVFLGINPGRNILVFHIDRNPANCNPNNLSTTNHNFIIPRNKRSSYELDKINEIISQNPGDSPLQLMQKLRAAKIEVSHSYLYSILRERTTEVNITEIRSVETDRYHAAEFISQHPGCKGDEVLHDLIDRYLQDQEMDKCVIMVLIAAAVDKTCTWEYDPIWKWIMAKTHVRLTIGMYKFMPIVDTVKTASRFAKKLRDLFDINDI